jgi:tetratricopeptide (TPR) repeat protein
MKPRAVLNIFRYSFFCYLVVAGILFFSVNREQMQLTRYYYLAGIAKNQDFKNDLDNLLFMEYGVIYEPQGYEQRLRLGVGYFNLGNYQRAEQVFKEALHMKPDSSEAQQYLKLAETGKRGEVPDPLRLPITGNL